MKRLVNLGIILVAALVIIGCQKEEVYISQDLEKTIPAVNPSGDVPGTVFEPAPVPTSPTYEPSSTFFPALGNGGQTTDDTPPTTGNSPTVPNGGIYDRVTPPVWEGDMNEIIGNLPTNERYRKPTITWSTNPPTDSKWKMYVTDDSSVTKARAIPANFCPYEDCDTALSAAVANLQIQANIYCQDMYSCVACCVDGNIVYAMIIAYHQCGIIPQDDPQDF